MFCDCCNTVHEFGMCPILDDEPEIDFIDEMVQVFDGEYDG